MEDELEPLIADDLNSALGFNGERIDPELGGYHLGNGYRLYSPSLRRFTSPDSLSPFGKGGINPYAYCEGDPINNTDPTGHRVRLGGIFGDIVEGMDTAFDVAAAVATEGESLAVIHAVSGVVALSTEITSQSIKASPKTHKILDGISFFGSAINTTTGLIDVGADLHKNGIKSLKTAKGIIKLTSSGTAVVSASLEVTADILTMDPSRRKVDTTLEKAGTWLGFISSVAGYVDGAPDFFDNIKTSHAFVTERFGSRHEHTVTERHATGHSHAPQQTTRAQYDDPLHREEPEDNDLRGPFPWGFGHPFS